MPNASSHRTTQRTSRRLGEKVDLKEEASKYILGPGEGYYPSDVVIAFGNWSTQAQERFLGPLAIQMYKNEHHSLPSAIETHQIQLLRHVSCS